jgi:hypothetical protein
VRENDFNVQAYWKVKNNFGESWRGVGYARLQRNRNVCGLGSKLYHVLDVAKFD